MTKGASERALGAEPAPAQPLTIRLEGDVALVSADDGRTCEVLDADVAAIIRRLSLSAPRAGTTASMLGALAEAEFAAPTVAAPVPGETHGRSRGTPSTVGEPVTSPVLDDNAFARLLRNRCSQRSLGNADIHEVLAVTHQCMRTTATALADDGSILRHRGTPSAGARHPIEAVLVNVSLSGLSEGSWWVDGDRGESRHLLLSAPDMLPLVERCLAAGGWDVPPPGFVVLIANFAATTTRYAAGATLVWRDAGALSATLHLAFAAAGLASCILGVGGPVPTELADALGWHAGKRDLGLVGAIAVGSAVD
jgi:hypothetical protein